MGPFGVGRTQVRGEVSEAEIETGELALMGFNFPPSQFQLHVQYAPLTD